MFHEGFISDDVLSGMRYACLRGEDLTEDSVASKVLEIIARQKRIPADQVTIDNTFQELGLDSLDAVNILFELEGEFNISISDDQARQIKNVRQMVDGVTSLVSEKKTA